MTSPASEQDPAAIDAPLLQSALADCAIVKRFFYFEDVLSTSTWARDYIQRAGPGAAVTGTLVVAAHQTAGRGRHQRRWHAPPGTALLFSLILTDNLDILPAAAPVAIAAALREIPRVPATIKWPNDILIGDSKVAGILIERAGIAAILGIGINVNQLPTDFPEEIRQTAGSLRTATGAFHAPSPILAAVLNHLDHLLSPAGRPSLPRRLQEWCVTVGRHVRVDTPNESLTGVAMSVTDHGSLVLRLDSGIQREILAADITHLRPAG